MQRRLYGLTIELLSDIPTADPVIPWPFELWLERIPGHPDFTPDGPLFRYKARPGQRRRDYISYLPSDARMEHGR